MGTDSHVSDQTARIRVETLLAVDNLQKLPGWGSTWKFMLTCKWGHVTPFITTREPPSRIGQARTA